jgi:hypothetical protein
MKSRPARAGQASTLPRQDTTGLRPVATSPKSPRAATTWTMHRPGSAETLCQAPLGTPRSQTEPDAATGVVPVGA